jgi:natural product biosynthesis luciferase-like monooxygenase protein
VTDPDRPLDFGLFYFGNASVEDERQKFRLLREGAIFADNNGYGAVWTPERHFNEFGGLFPTPSLLGAALSVLTKNISIRAGSVVVPLHNPLRLAEEWSVVDNLSGGRAGIACAPGWQSNDFVLCPQNFENRHEIMYRNIAILKDLWQGKSIHLVDGKGASKDTRIFPRPIQKDLPLWITSRGNTETFRSAGKLGANVLTHLLGETLEDLESNIRIYREEYANAGHDPESSKVVLMLHTYVGPDLESTYAKARIPFINYLRTSLGLLKMHARSSGINTDVENLTSRDLEDMLNYSFYRYVSSSSLIGTKETCLDMLRKVSRAGVDEIACLIDFGIDFESTMQGLELLTEVKQEYRIFKSELNFT